MSPRRVFQEPSHRGPRAHVAAIPLSDQREAYEEDHEKHIAAVAAANHGKGFPYMPRVSI